VREIVQLLIKNDIAAYDEIEGCSKKEIRELENYFGLLLPQLYREFLLTMGHGAGKLFRGTDIFYVSLFELRQAAEELLEDNGVDFRLPGDSFVFSMHQGYEFLYFEVSDGQDPPVYQFVEGDEAPAKQWESFSEFLLDSLVTHSSEHE
jgi:hypothetical protein